MSDESGAAAERPASKATPWLMILIAVAALAAGGGGAMFYVATQAQTQAQAEQGKDKTKEKGRPKQPPQYVELDPPFVVNFEAKGLMRFLQVSIEVMTRDLATVDLIKTNDPMIRNDLILLLGNLRYEDINTREGKERLREEALQVVANVIDAEGGDGSKVEQLYFTSFVMQ